MPKPTIRFYNHLGTYMGWKYLTQVTYFELLNWLKSGNTLRWKDQELGPASTSAQIFLVLRRTK
jgi:hypothetical protein